MLGGEVTVGEPDDDPCHHRCDQDYDQQAIPTRHRNRRSTSKGVGCWFGEQHPGVPAVVASHSGGAASYGREAREDTCWLSSAH